MAMGSELSQVFMVGQVIDGVIIDDIIQNTDTKEIFCYDELSNLLVRIPAGVDTLIECVEANLA
jgi:hypothetical protein